MMETENIIMFSIGLTIFVLYMVGYLLMVKKANDLQKSKVKIDPKLKKRKDKVFKDVPHLRIVYQKRHTIVSLAVAEN